MFTSATVTVGGVVGTLSMVEPTAARLTWWSSKMLSLENAEPPATAIREALSILWWCATPTLAGALVGSVVSGVLTAGFEVHLGPLLPSARRLDPFEGFRKLFSAKSFVEVVKTLVVSGVVTAVMWQGVAQAAPVVFRAVTRGGTDAMVVTLALLGPLCLKAAFVLLALGLADWGYARYRHRQDLMMSLEDVKQEHKNAEGDPHAKAKRKAEHHRVAQGGARRGTRAATAIVVNPTHIAIALRYDETECEAPYLVAKGQETDAMNIRKEANLAGIPIVKDVPLARALIHYDVGEQVPEELYRAAAAVLKVAYETVNRRDHQGNTLT